MVLLDPIEAPSGREQVTQRPSWRVRLSDGRTLWAFIELRDGNVWITGYPQYQVTVLRSPQQPAAGFIVGAGTGALIGAAFGGPAGALIGGALGAIFGAGSTNGARLG